MLIWIINFVHALLFLSGFVYCALSARQTASWCYSLLQKIRNGKLYTDATTSSQSGPGIDGNKRVFHIPQRSITGVSSSYCFMSYPEHSLVESYHSTKMQSWILQLLPTGETRESEREDRTGNSVIR